MLKNMLFLRLWIGRYFGIDTYLHWSWLLFVGLFLLLDFYVGIFLVAIFACVLLHEFGHCLAAQRYGIEVKNIHLFPIGGVAQIPMEPDKPRQEFWVTAAGPAVNFVLAGMLFLMTSFFTPLEIKLNSPADFGMWEWFSMMWIVNLFLAVFNLLPVFPMDGGRLLRSALSWSTGNFLLATRIAARLGQALCLSFVAIGFWYNAWSWVVIGLLIMVFAEAELRYAVEHNWAKRNREVLDSLEEKSQKELFQLLATARGKKDIAMQEVLLRALCNKGLGSEEE